MTLDYLFLKSVMVGFQERDCATWLVPQDPIEAELRWDITATSARLATATTTGVETRRRARSLNSLLRLLSNTVCKLIDVHVGRFLVPDKPGWVMHLGSISSVHNWGGLQNNCEHKKKMWARAQALYYRSHFHRSTLHRLFLRSTQSLHSSHPTAETIDAAFQIFPAMM